MYSLGISAFYHDSAAALLKNGVIIAAAQEERFTRIKHDAVFPHHAICYCLEQAVISMDEIEHIIFYEKPFIKFERLLETYMAYAPRGVRSFIQAMPVWIKEKLFQRRLLRQALSTFPQQGSAADRLLFSEHHLSHAASAYFPSPFEDALVLTMDGVGEWATTTVAVGQGHDLEIVREIHFPHSLGLLYSAFTYYTGFRVNSGEYKMMGLAPYGEPRFKRLIYDHLIDVKDDGSFRLDQQYFNYCTGLTMTNKRFDKLFGRSRREDTEDIDQFYMDVAASIQAVTEEVVLTLARALALETGQKNLCLAGGVALNCVVNGKLARSGVFENVWVQPASGDAGGALGAAYCAYHLHGAKPRTAMKPDAMQGGYLGPAFAQSDIQQRLDQQGARYKLVDRKDLLTEVASSLADGKVVGWFQGRMEFGPRALGARSILGDPRNTSMQKQMNLKIKFRESFRPFAPAVLADYADKWFEIDYPGPYMQFVCDIKDKHLRVRENSNYSGLQRVDAVRSSIPAVTHIDNSARVQTVHKKTNPLFHALISRFHEMTNCPVIINTSFNIRGEPIVNTPEEAFRCFMGTHMDVLVVGDCLLIKSEQDSSTVADYRDEFELD